MNAGRRTRTRGFGAPRPKRPGTGRRWLGLALALFVAAASAQEGGARIAYVDMQRLIDNAPQMLAARERLKREFDAQDASLQGEIAKLGALDQRVRDEAATLPEAELSALKRQADALRAAIARTGQRLRAELAARTDQELDRAWPEINETVAEYAREVGYDLVVQSPVVYVSGRIDITDRVLERLKRDAAQAQAQP